MFPKSRALLPALSTSCGGHCSSTPVAASPCRSVSDSLYSFCICRWTLYVDSSSGLCTRLWLLYVTHLMASARDGGCSTSTLTASIGGGGRSTSTPTVAFTCRSLSTPPLNLTCRSTSTRCSPSTPLVVSTCHSMSTCCSLSTLYMRRPLFIDRCFYLDPFRCVPFCA